MVAIHRQAQGFLLLAVSASLLIGCGGDSDSVPRTATSPTVNAAPTVRVSLQPAQAPTADTSTPTPLVASPTAPATATDIPLVAPTPTTPLATSGNAEIYIINVDGTGERNLTNATTVEWSPVWSPDGSRIGFRRSDSFGLGGGAYSMLPDGTDIQELLPEKRYGYDELGWLAGNRIAFMTCDGIADCGVFTADPGDENRSRLPAPDTGYEQIAWSPDGTRIAYINSQGENREVNVMTVVDGSIRQLTESPGDERGPTWSPDGQSIAFSRWDEERASSSIYVIDADASGAEPQRIYSNVDDAYAPEWSPDGTRIVFVLSSFGPGSVEEADLWIVNADGTEPRQLTDAPFSDNDPAWSPDGSTIVFVSYRDGGQPIACSYGSIADLAEPIPMDALAWDSHAIVVGTIAEVFPAAFGDPLNPDVDRMPTIYSDFLLDVELQFRGQPVDGAVRLRLPGGAIGDCLQSHEPGLELAIGDRLLLFLYPAYPDDTLPDAFAPTIQGVWIVAADDTLESPSYAYNPPGYDGMSLDEVHALIVEALSGEPPSDAWNPIPLDEAPLTEGD